jgi:hypothetical protein
MARPKGKLFALLAVFAAIGLVAASGAFTTVEADRSVDVNTSGDASALLSLDAESPSPNADDYVSGSGNEIQINLNTTNSAGGGNGINQDALTDVDDLINITNQGSQEVEVHIVMDEGGSSLSNLNNSVDFTVDGSSGGATSVPDTLDRSSTDSGSGSSVTLPVGESVTIGIEIDLTGVSTGSSDTILNDITIVANATA